MSDTHLYCPTHHSLSQPSGLKHQWMKGHALKDRLFRHVCGKRDVRVAAAVHRKALAFQRDVSLFFVKSSTQIWSFWSLPRPRHQKSLAVISVYLFWKDEWGDPQALGRGGDPGSVLNHCGVSPSRCAWAVYPPHSSGKGLYSYSIIIMDWCWKT